MKTETCSPAELIGNIRPYRVRQTLYLSGHTNDGKAFSGEWLNYYPATHLDPPGRIELYSQDSGESVMIWVKDIRDLEHSPLWADPIEQKPGSPPPLIAALPKASWKN